MNKLIDCPDCGQQISANAVACPGCGYSFGKVAAKRFGRTLGVVFIVAFVLYMIIVRLTMDTG